MKVEIQKRSPCLLVLFAQLALKGRIALTLDTKLFMNLSLEVLMKK